MSPLSLHLLELTIQTGINDSFGIQFLNPSRSRRSQYVTQLPFPRLSADRQWTLSCLQHGHLLIHLESVFGPSECKLEYHVIVQADNQGCGHDSLYDSHVCSLVECRGHSSQAWTRFVSLTEVGM